MRAPVVEISFKRATLPDPNERYVSIFEFSQDLHKLKPLYDYRGIWRTRSSI